MRTGRRNHLVIIAVVLISAFLFLRLSWSRLGFPANPENESLGTPHLKEGTEHNEVQPDSSGRETRPAKEEVEDGEGTKEVEPQLLSGRPSNNEEHSPEGTEMTLQPTLDKSHQPTKGPEAGTAPPPLPDRVVVMGRLRDEDTSWVGENLKDWQHAIYTVNDHKSHGLHTVVNKGREAMPYLTYLVDNYEDLPSIIVFLHAHRSGYPKAWHNEGDDHDVVTMLHSLNIDFVQRTGYANLRCVHIPGCPDEVQPFREPFETHRTTEHAMRDVWHQLFPGDNTSVPKTIGVACCGQFAVSREQVRKRPLADYQWYLDWLIKTPLDDDTSGRVFEYLWHVIFGREPV